MKELVISQLSKYFWVGENGTLCIKWLQSKAVNTKRFLNSLKLKLQNKYQRPNTTNYTAECN